MEHSFVVVRAFPSGKVSQLTPQSAKDRLVQALVDDGWDAKTDSPRRSTLRKDGIDLEIQIDRREEM